MVGHQGESRFVLHLVGIGWIYDRMKRHPKGVADFSDAGMVYFLLTGDEDGSPEKFKVFIGKGINHPKP